MCSEHISKKNDILTPWFPVSVLIVKTADDVSAERENARGLAPRVRPNGLHLRLHTTGFRDSKSSYQNGYFVKSKFSFTFKRREKWTATLPNLHRQN